MMAESNRQIKNIILDVDGTLWDSTTLVAQVWTDLMRERCGISWEVTPEQLKQLFGKTMDVIEETLFADREPTERKRLLELCLSAEEEALQLNEKSLLYPHVFDTLQLLSGDYGKRLYIVSNCQTGYIELFMEKNNVESLITDTECFGNTGMAKGANIRLLMERNGLRTEETVYVGDTQGDYEAACETGIAFLFAAYGFGHVEGTEAFWDFAKLPEML